MDLLSLLSFKGNKTVQLVKSTLPSVFQDQSTMNVLINGSEIFVETPSELKVIYVDPIKAEEFLVAFTGN